MTEKLKIGIFNKFVFENSLFFAPWAETLDADYRLYADYDFTWCPEDDLDILITHLHYSEPEASILRKLTFETHSLPVLILADGILEYRNTWHKPSVPPGAIFQPLLGHKIATVGRSQARILESWGNLGKCEIVGMPRFDRYAHAHPRKRSPGEAFNVLIMTAKTPGFTSLQVQAVVQSLKDLKAWFDLFSKHLGPDIHLLWRLTDDLAENVGVDNTLSDLGGGELAGILQSVDAMITTPSTAMLEGMLQGIPVAILDYNNCPHFVPAAWTITAPQHFQQIIPSLLNPAPARMLYQETILHDALECQTPAAERMVQLIQAMADIGRACRAQQKPLNLPTRILPDPQSGHHLPEPYFDMERLFPEHPVFANLDRAALQVEIGHLKVEVERLRTQLSTLQFETDDLRHSLDSAEACFSSSYYWRARTKLSQLKHVLLSQFKVNPD